MIKTRLYLNLILLIFSLQCGFTLDAFYAHQLRQEVARIESAREIAIFETQFRHARELLGEREAGRLLLGGGVHSHSVVRAFIETVWYKASAKASSDLSAVEAERVTETILTESSRYHFDPVFLLAVIEGESRFNPKARGAHGEIGLMQIKPKTAEWIAKKYDIKWTGPRSLESSKTNIEIGAAYIDFLRKRFKSSGRIYLSAYNMGPGNTLRLLSVNSMPQVYAGKMLGIYRKIHKTLKDIGSERS